jgi:hypothetical protein
MSVSAEVNYSLNKLTVVALLNGATEARIAKFKKIRMVFCFVDD